MNQHSAFKRHQLWLFLAFSIITCSSTMVIAQECENATQSGTYSCPYGCPDYDARKPVSVTYTFSGIGPYSAMEQTCGSDDAADLCGLDLLEMMHIQMAIAQV